MGGCLARSTGAGEPVCAITPARALDWAKTGVVGARHAGLHAFPAEALRLTRATVVDFGNNRLTLLPDIGGFVLLARLVLSNNDLEMLPGSLSGLQTLRVLLVDGNRLTSLPSCAGLARLERLDASRNRLVALPPLPSTLLALLVATNGLTELPMALGSACPRLEEIDAADNELSSLPESLGALGALRSLSLAGNRALAAVPAAVLAGCGALHAMTLERTGVSVEKLEATPGFELFAARRRARHARAIAGDGVLLGDGGLR